MSGRAPATGRLAALAFLLSGCMPWVAGETARTVPRGDLRVGAAVTALAAPTEPSRPFPVPQAWVATGLGQRTDVRLDYAVPLTFHARVKHHFLDDPLSLAASVGGGIHGLPGPDEQALSLGTPFVSLTLHASRATPGADSSAAGARGEAYGALGLLAPFVTEDGGAVTLWVTPRAGWSVERGDFRWGPEIGAVVPTLHPGDTLLLAGVWASWSP